MVTGFSLRTRILVYACLISGLLYSSKSFSMIPDSTQDNSTRNLTISYFHGYLYPHHRLVTYFNTEYINGFDLAISSHVPALNHLHPPEIGGGYYFSNLGSREVYGYAHSLYFFVGRDYFQCKLPVYLQQSIGTGVSFNTKHFDISENYSNRLIGSHLNIFFIYTLNLKARFGERMLFSIGPAFVHTSNGNISQPNFGLNLISTRMSLTYTMDRDGKKSVVPIHYLPDFNKNRYLIVVAGGVRELSHRIPKYFTVGSIMTDYTRRLDANLALGLGMDFIYDPTEGMPLYVIGAQVENIIPWHIGTHLSYERIWNHFSLVINSGYKIITPSEHYNRQYNRVGIRYRFNNHFVLNYSLKSHKFVADFLEFGVGYIIE